MPPFAFGTRLSELDSNAMTRPSSEIEGHSLSEFPCSPAVLTLTRTTVSVWPACTFFSTSAITFPTSTETIVPGKRLRAESVLLSFASRKDVLRAVTHLDVSAEDIEQAIERIPRALASTDRPVELAADAPTPY